MENDNGDNPLFIDIETYYDTRKKYGVRNMTTTEYVYDDRACIIAVGAMRGNGGYEVWTNDWPDDNENAVESLTQWLMGIGYLTGAVIAHNGYFDFQMIRCWTGLIPEFMQDTMLMNIHLFGQPSAAAKYYNLAGGRNTLESLQVAHWEEFFGGKLMHYDNVQLNVFKQGGGKDILKSMDGVRNINHLSALDQELFRAYLYVDVAFAHFLYYKLIDYIPAAQRLTINWALHQYVAPVLQLDTVILSDIHRKEEAEIDDACRMLKTDRKEVGSSQKFALLLEGYGVDVPMKQGANGPIPAFAKDDIGMMNLRDGIGTQYPVVVRDLVNLRLKVKGNQMSKRAMSYAKVGDAMDRATGEPWWPVHMIPSGAHTHRPTGSSGGGGNPLNLNRGSRLREAVVAPDGYYLVVFDYSGIELRVTRYIANDQPAIQTIEAGGDGYADFARHVFHEGKMDRTVTKVERWIGKQSELSLQYGVGSVKMTDNLNQKSRAEKVNLGSPLNRRVVDDIVESFRHEVHPALPEWWHELDEYIESWATYGGKASRQWINKRLKRWNIPMKATNHGFVWNSGRVLRYPHVGVFNFKQGNKNRDGYGYRLRGLQSEPKKIYGAMMCENISQSLTNEIVDERQHEIERRTGWRVVLQVYDEMIVAVPNDVPEDEAVGKIREIATAPIVWWLAGPQLDIEIGSGQNFLECK